ncbi:terminase large subunit [Candidatus Palauibacter sp.]|uniref:terminase large subunit n=1 Tax=Candidatus Palauibacter sp. TaxID=3101350 RepID=UPI003CC50E4B
MGFDAARAAHALDFMSLCPLIKGASAKLGLTLGDVWLDYQVDGLRELFGRVDDQGLRQYRIAFWFLPKKSGKSTLAAAVALYGLFADGEEGPEVYSVAKDRDQAALVFDVAAQMRVRMPELKAVSTIREHLKTISYPARSGFYKVLTADAAGTHGIIPSFVVFDEIHTQKDRRMWAAIEESMRTVERREPLLFVITHAGEDTDTLAYELWEHAKAIQAGERTDPQFFPMIYGADPGDDWTDPAVWRKAIPGLGKLVLEKEIAAAVERAKVMPSAQYDLRRYQLNEWLEGGIGWIDLADWDACSGPVPEDELVGRECTAGLDLSSTTDMTALGLVFAREDGTHDTLMWYWVPEENAGERGRKDHAPYLEWIDQGRVCATPGARVDYAFIRACLVGPDPLVKQAAAVAESRGHAFDAEEALWAARSRLARAGLPENGLSSKYRIAEIAYDPWNATQLAIQLEEEDGFRMVETRQGYRSLNGPMKELEALVAARQLRHGGHPVLRHNVAGVRIKEDAAGYVQPNKKRSRSRIDGVVALLMALGASMLRRHEEERDSWLVAAPGFAGGAGGAA